MINVILMNLFYAKYLHEKKGQSSEINSANLPLLSHWEQWMRASGLPFLLASLPLWQMPHIALGMTLGCKGRIML